jgi:hypothetical protein
MNCVKRIIAKHFACIAKKEKIGKQICVLSVEFSYLSKAHRPSAWNHWPVLTIITLEPEATMANESLAVSMRHRNSILKFVPANKHFFDEKCTGAGPLDPYSFLEMNTVIGLAFTAILAAGLDLELCLPEMNIFLHYRDSFDHWDKYDIAIVAVTRILENGFTAFKKLGYPYYFDDFLWAYNRVLHSPNTFSFKIKQEMERMLDTMF